MSIDHARRQIAVVTSARSDFGILIPVMRAIGRHSKLRLRILATGMHLSAKFGGTLDEIHREGFSEPEIVRATPESDNPRDIGRAMGDALSGFSSLFGDRRPDLLLVLGDRYDMMPAVMAALPFCIPLAHIAGGEATEGLIDEAIRHSVTKCSHLHFVTTPGYGARVEQLGEEPWRVIVTGNPSIDNLRTMSIPDRAEVCRRFDLEPSCSFGLVTIHPVTLQYDRTGDHVGELLAALDWFDMPWLFTYPNADTANSRIVDAVREFVGAHARCRIVRSAGQSAYYGLMRSAALMVGNSSSGIIEAASFELPVVNVGSRQRGRLRAGNVIDVDCDRAAIVSATTRALDPEFRRSLHGLVNPYGDGHAAERIANRLADQPLDERLILKRFHLVRESLVGVH